MTVVKEDSGTTGRERGIRSDERSGVLHPRNLHRYGATWFDPDPAVGSVVDQYWHVHWNLPGGETIDQRIIDFPAITLTIEEGDVPAPFVATGLHARAWQRQIVGSGTVFAIRLRPAGLAILSDLAPQQLADQTLPVTGDLDPRLLAVLAQIAAAQTPQDRAHVANRVILERSSDRPLRSELLLANAVVTELSRHRARTGATVADTFGVSERTIQRALRTTLGRGPKWVSKRIRLQEVARALASADAPDLAALAAQLGYADQAHLTADFRTTAGTTPGAYARDLRTLVE